jgi:SNF family Na+-dependent transporter
VFKLGFISLPMVFSEMPLGNYFGFFWFFLLFLAALTSSISMLQPAIAFFEEALGVGRRVSVTILGLITLAGTLFIMYFTKDQKALDIMDFWVGTFFIFTLATIEVILFSWVFGARRILNEAKHGALIKLPGMMEFVLKYISPVYLILIFGFWTYQNVPNYIQKIYDDPVVRMTTGLIFILFVFFTIMIRNGVNRWEKL